MSKTFFQRIENKPHNDRLPLAQVLAHLNYNEQRLIPVITQDVVTRRVLMMAWMNTEALLKTLSSGRMVYWSRSRMCLWEKGATSGHTQSLVKMAFDCDGDVILCHVEQTGAACHTGRSNCFYLEVDEQQQQVQVIGEAQNLEQQH